MNSSYFPLDRSNEWLPERQAVESALLEAVAACTGEERKAAAKALANTEKFSNNSSKSFPSAALAYACWMEVSFHRAFNKSGHRPSPAFEAAYEAVEMLIDRLYVLRLDDDPVAF